MGILAAKISIPFPYLPFSITYTHFIMEKSILTEIFLPLALAIIMLGMGLSLQMADFRRIALKPKATVLGLLNQLVLLPLMGFGIAKALDLPGELAVGLMLLAACPGGVTSNLITHLAKGDTALSITLTAISSLITIVTIPIVVNFSMQHFLSVEKQIAMDVPKMILQIAVITLIPVAIGMFIRSRSAVFAAKMEKPVKIISAVFLVLIIVAAVLKDRANLGAYLAMAGPATLALNVATMLVGYFSAKLLRLPSDQATTISIESGIQNGTLAIGIALGILNSAPISIPPAIYSLIMFATGGVVIALGSRRKG